MRSRLEKLRAQKEEAVENNEFERAAKPTTRCYSVFVGDHENGEEKFVMASSFGEAVQKTVDSCKLEDESEVIGVRVMDGGGGDSLNKDCNQCGGSGLVADIAAFPKPAWDAWENRPKAGPDPMTDFVKAVPCPTCYKEKEVSVEQAVAAGEAKADESNQIIETGVLTLAQRLREKAVGYTRRAESLNGLADVAEGLTPGSNAERAFIDFIKTQGADL